MSDFDYALVGAGLQNGLLSAALAELQPGASVVLIDRASALGTAHTWCFHETDLEAELSPAITPFIAHQWPGYDVAFPSYSRTVRGTYNCITGESFDSAVRSLFEQRSHYALRLGVPAVNITPRAVELASGERVTASVVIEARGPGRLESSAIAGFQKFLGLEVELATPTELRQPLLMDARVQQLDGYRFLYVLPFSPRRLLIEDTYFSDSAELDTFSLRARVLRYAEESGFVVDRIIREEVGVLPLPARLSPSRAELPLRAGYQGGWFHPTTGYSFPVAARLAALIARASKDSLQEALGAQVRSHAVQTRFCCLLNQLLFGGFEEDDRRNVFERFYRLPEPTIARFYSLRTTALDRARVICGKPPRGVSLRRLLANQSSWGAASASPASGAKTPVSETGTRGNHS